MAFVAEVIPQEDCPKFIDNPVWDKLTYRRSQITHGFSRWVVDRDRDMFVRACYSERTSDLFAIHLHGEFVKFRTHARSEMTDSEKYIYSILWYVYDVNIPYILEAQQINVLQYIKEFCEAAGGTGLDGPEKYSEIKVLFQTPPFEFTIY